MRRLAFALLAGLMLAAPAQANVSKIAWGQTPGHQQVDLYTLSNGVLTAKISTYGGALVSLLVPDSNGHDADVVRGYDRLEDYLVPGQSHVGAIIGRYANRIKGASFTLDGKVYHLPAGRDGNTTHGGTIGFDKRVWTAHAHDGPSPSLVLTYRSWDGEMNFPGTLDVTVTYALVGKTLRISFDAVTDKPTVLNLINHTYFNLKGAENGDILDHRLTINADSITLNDRDATANGQIKAVAGTGLDFRAPMRIGAHIDDTDDPQIAVPKGYDQDFVIRGKPGTLRLAARVEEPSTGRALECWTTQPGVQIYTANFGSSVGKGGAQYKTHGAFTLETQHFANAPNIPSFPSTVLRPGQKFHEVTEFRFSATPVWSILTTDNEILRPKP